LLSVFGLSGACFSNRSYPLKRKSRSEGATFETWAGEKELALQQLEMGLRAPNASITLSYGAPRLLPFCDLLRGDPRFERIVTSLAPKDAASTAK
jgi:hypothetical protein